MKKKKSLDKTTFIMPWIHADLEAPLPRTEPPASTIDQPSSAPQGNK